MRGFGEWWEAGLDKTASFLLFLSSLTSSGLSPKAFASTSPGMAVMAEVGPTSVPIMALSFVLKTMYSIPSLPACIATAKFCGTTDIFNPRAGRVRTINSLTLPVLKLLRLSAQWVKLYKVTQIYYQMLLASCCYLFLQSYIYIYSNCIRTTLTTTITAFF